MTWLTVEEYLYHKWPPTCFVFRNHNPVLCSFITYHRICIKSNPRGATNIAGIAHYSGAPEWNNNTPQVLQRTSLGLVPHKANPTCMFIVYEKFEDTKGVIGRRKSKKIDHTMTKRKRTNNDLLKTTQKSKDWTILPLWYLQTFRIL
jgi:hypothetical protein